MIEERGGWFVKNVRDATWMKTEEFGKACGFDVEDPFPQVGIHIFLLEPGKPNCRYHREEAQEDFLVLSGNCKVLVNGEELALKPWDLVHCPAGVSHVLVGGEEGPAAVLAIGHRPGKGIGHGDFKLIVLAPSSVQEAVDEIGQVVEGVKTSAEIWRLAGRLGVDMPIAEQIYGIIHEGRDPYESLRELLSREQKHETV